MISYRITITLIWWVLGTIILLSFFWVSADRNIFGEYRSQGFDWLLPNLIPTMTLTGAVAYSAPKASDDAIVPTRQVRFAFLFACALSLIYLAVLAATIALALTEASESPRGVIDALTSWNKLLCVLQGFAASAIGIFFVRN